jgi:hypothetical protein
MSVFGPSSGATWGPSPGSYLVTAPSKPWADTTRYNEEDDYDDPLLTWCRNATAVLHREKQPVTERMGRAMNLYRGGTPWWRNRPRWKLGKQFNKCATVPIQWASILSDNKPLVTYSAYRSSDQRIADIATAAFKEAYEKGKWQQKIRNAILGSRIQIKYFLRLVPDQFGPGGETKFTLTVVTGEQVFADANATCVDDAEVLLYEYRESPNKIFARWPHLRDKIIRKRSEQRGFENTDNNGDVLSPPTTMTFPDGGGTLNNPPFAASANPPDNSGGTSGLIVREFWTRPRKTTKVTKVLFTAGGEPATREKKVTLTDGDTQRLRRVITEGNVVYEWPEEYVAIVREAEIYGGLRIINEMDALEVINHKVDYPLYPDGRLVVIVDEDFKAEDRMNPLGYIPLIEIEAYPDPQQFWGLSDLDLIADAYEYWIRLLGLMYDAANLTANPIWRLPLGDEMADEDITNAPGAIQRETQMSLRYGKREPGPDMPQYVYQLLQYSEGQIRELSGLNEISSGTAKFKGQQSSETVSMYQEAAGVRFNDSLHRIEGAMVQLGEQFLEGATRFYTTPQLVRIKNAAGIVESIPFLGSQLSAPLKVEAKPGSNRTPTQRFNSLMNLLGSGKALIDLPEVWRQLQEMGLIDSATALERRMFDNLKDPSKNWLITGQIPGSAPNASQAKKPGGKRKSSQSA